MEPNLSTLTQAGSGFSLNEDGEVVFDDAITTPSTDAQPNVEDTVVTEQTTTDDEPLDGEALLDPVKPVEPKVEEEEKQKEVKPDADKVEEEITPDNVFNLPFLPEEQAKEIEWSKLGGELGFENAETIKSKEDFQILVKSEIEKHKQIVEPDFSKHGEEAKIIYEQLEKGADLRDILNPIRHLDAFVLSSDEYKVSFMLQQEGYEGEALQDKLEELKDSNKLKGLAEDHTRLAESLISQQLQDIDKQNSERRSKLIEQQTQQLNSELKQLEDYVSELKDFRGLEIPDATKKVIISEIKSGKFKETIDNAKTQVTAYLEAKFGDKVAKISTDKLSEAERAAYNKAKKAELDSLHNIPPKAKPGVIAPVVSKKFDGGNLSDLFDLSADL